VEEINVRGKPKGLAKYFRRIPSYLFKLGLSKPFEATTLLISTQGRKTRGTTKTPLGFAKKGEIIYLVALYQNSDWFKNALKYPEIEVQIGKEHMKAHASKVDVPKEKAESYIAIIKAQGEKGAEKYYYIKPGMNDEEIGAIGAKLPILRLDLTG